MSNKFSYIIYTFSRFSRAAQDSVLPGKPRRHVQWATFPYQLFYFLAAARFSHRGRIVGNPIPVSVTHASYRNNCFIRDIPVKVSSDEYLQDA